MNSPFLILWEPQICCQDSQENLRCQLFGDMAPQSHLALPLVLGSCLLFFFFLSPTEIRNTTRHLKGRQQNWNPARDLRGHYFLRMWCLTSRITMAWTVVEMKAKFNVISFCKHHFGRTVKMKSGTRNDAEAPDLGKSRRVEAALRPDLVPWAFLNQPPRILWSSRLFPVMRATDWRAPSKSLWEPGRKTVSGLFLLPSASLFCWA